MFCFPTSTSTLNINLLSVNVSFLTSKYTEYSNTRISIFSPSAGSVSTYVSIFDSDAASIAVATLMGIRKELNPARTWGGGGGRRRRGGWKEGRRRRRGMGRKKKTKKGDNKKKGGKGGKGGMGGKGGKDEKKGVMPHFCDTKRSHILRVPSC